MRSLDGVTERVSQEGEVMSRTDRRLWSEISEAEHFQR